MSTSGTGPHHQRESIYFTVVQQPTHLSPPSTSPQPERKSVTAKININKKNRYSGDFSPLVGSVNIIEQSNKEEEQQQKIKNRQQQLSIQRSKSQQILTKLTPTTSELLPDDSNNNAGQNDSPPVMQGSEPGSIKVSRRQLRFVIPQVFDIFYLKTNSESKNQGFLPHIPLYRALPHPLILEFLLTFSISFLLKFFTKVFINNNTSKRKGKNIFEEI